MLKTILVCSALALASGCTSRPEECKRNIEALPQPIPALKERLLNDSDNVSEAEAAAFMAVLMSESACWPAIIEGVGNAL